MESLHVRPGRRRAVCQVAAKHSAPAPADTSLMNQHQRAEQKDEPCNLCMLLNLPNLMPVVCVRSLMLLPVCDRRHLCDEPTPGTEQKDDLSNLRTTSILSNLMSAVCVPSLLLLPVCPCRHFCGEPAPRRRTEG